MWSEAGLEGRKAWTSVASGPEPLAPGLNRANAAGRSAALASSHPRILRCLETRQTRRLAANVAACPSSTRARIRHVERRSLVHSTAPVAPLVEATSPWQLPAACHRGRSPPWLHLRAAQWLKELGTFFCHACFSFSRLFFVSLCIIIIIINRYVPARS
jgi:hypothetical protein